jgi:hypothetical protein
VNFCASAIPEAKPSGVAELRAEIRYAEGVTSGLRRASDTFGVPKYHACGSFGTFGNKKAGHRKPAARPKIHKLNQPKSGLFNANHHVG